MGLALKQKKSCGFNISLLALFCLVTVSCDKKTNTDSLVINKEAVPIAPVITSPTTLPTYSSSTPTLRIKGCYDSQCRPNVASLTIQASGIGTLQTDDHGFTFDAEMVANETRVFSFTQTNVKGDVSPPVTLTVTFDATFQLTPLATLYNGGTSTSAPKASSNNSFVLNFLTSLPSLASSPIQSGGFVLTAGALNPK